MTHNSKGDHKATFTKSGENTYAEPVFSFTI
jgi:hypothetical protein